jgi:GTP diphosphokinase / guanosine-3',5'-bis(diphosphate) 3'-diphosphatase
VLGDRLVPVSWNPHITDGRPATYPVNIQIEAIDRLGLLKDILSHLMDQKINVRNANVKTSVDRPAIIDLCIDIRDKVQLDRAFSQVKK